MSRTKRRRRPATSRGTGGNGQPQSKVASSSKKATPAATKTKSGPRTGASNKPPKATWGQAIYSHLLPQRDTGVRAFLRTFSWGDYTPRELLIRYRSRISWPLVPSVFSVALWAGQSTYAAVFALMLWAASVIVLPTAVHAGIRSLVIYRRHRDELPWRPVLFAELKLLMCLLVQAAYFIPWGSL